MDCIFSAYSSPINTWVYDYQGNIMPGWPQAVNATVSGYSAGIYNNNYGFGDLGMSILRIF